MSNLDDWQWSEPDMALIEQGVQNYIDTLMGELLDGYPEEGPTETETGLPFCGCDTCMTRELMAFLMPRFLDLYEQGLIERVNATPKQGG